MSEKQVDIREFKLPNKNSIKEDPITIKHNQNFNFKDQVKKNISDEEYQVGVRLDSKRRFYVFLLLALTNILLNMDHGTIPAASNEIMEELKVEEAILGTFGSLVYLGNLIGAFLLIKLIDSTNRKKLSIISTLLNAAFVYSFIRVKNIYYLFFCRVIIGIMQSYICIYFPVWIDQFGMRKWKTIMMSIFNITSPLGVVLGFVLTMTVKTKLNVS